MNPHRLAIISADSATVNLKFQTSVDIALTNSDTMLIAPTRATFD